MEEIKIKKKKMTAQYIKVINTINKEATTLADVPNCWKEKGLKLCKRNVCNIATCGVSLLGFPQLGNSIYYLQTLIFGTTCYDLSYASFVWALRLPFLQIFGIGCLIKYSDSPFSLASTLAQTTSLRKLAFSNRGLDTTFKKFVSAELGEGLSRNSSLRELSFVSCCFDYDEIFSRKLPINTTLTKLKLDLVYPLPEYYNAQRNNIFAVIAQMPLLSLTLKGMCFPHEFFCTLSTTLQKLSLNQQFRKTCGLYNYLVRAHELKVLKTRSIVHPIPAHYFPTSLTCLDIHDEMEIGKTTQYYQHIASQLTLLTLPQFDPKDFDLLRGNTSLAVLKLRLVPSVQHHDDENDRDFFGYSDEETQQVNEKLEELVTGHTTLRILKLSSYRGFNFTADFFPGTNLTALYLKRIHCPAEFYDKIGQATSLRRLHTGSVTHTIPEALPVYQLPHLAYLDGIDFDAPQYWDAMSSNYSLLDVNSNTVFNPTRIPPQISTNKHNAYMKEVTLFELLVQHPKSKALRCPDFLDYYFELHERRW